MKILLIDTCGATGSIALADTTHSPALIASATLPGRAASERLVPTIRDLAANSGVGLQMLGAIAAVHGPGSFTGVRVGLSAAKGLCEALGLPLIAISRLAVLASLAGPPSGAPVHSLLDAGRGEFYFGLYAGGVCLREALLTREELLASIDLATPSPTAAGLAALQPTSKLASASVEQTPAFTARSPARFIVACEPAVAESLAALVPRLDLSLVAEPTAESALPSALLRIRQRAFDDPATTDANYLRRTDAEIFARPRDGAASISSAAVPSQAAPQRTTAG